MSRPFDSRPRHDTDDEGLREMVRFVEEIEKTPLPQLIRNLKAIEKESLKKFEHASRVTKRRLAELAPEVRDQLRSVVSFDESE